MTTGTISTGKKGWPKHKPGDANTAPQETPSHAPKPGGTWPAPPKKRPSKKK